MMRRLYRGVASRAKGLYRSTSFPTFPPALSPTPLISAQWCADATQHRSLRCRQQPRLRKLPTAPARQAGPLTRPFPKASIN